MCILTIEVGILYERTLYSLNRILQIARRNQMNPFAHTRSHTRTFSPVHTIPPHRVRFTCLLFYCIIRKIYMLFIVIFNVGKQNSRLTLPLTLFFFKNQFYTHADVGCEFGNNLWNLNELYYPNVGFKQSIGLPCSWQSFQLLKFQIRTAEHYFIIQATWIWASEWVWMCVLREYCLITITSTVNNSLDRAHYFQSNCLLLFFFILMIVWYCAVTGDRWLHFKFYFFAWLTLGELACLWNRMWSRAKTKLVGNRVRLLSSIVMCACVYVYLCMYVCILVVFVSLNCFVIDCCWMEMRAWVVSNIQFKLFSLILF